MSSSTFRHAVEIGAGDGYSSQLLAAGVAQFERVELYEPNEILYRDLCRAAAPYQHVIPIRAAVGPEKHNAHPLVHLGYASYLTGLPSFLRLSCEPEAEEHWKPLTRDVGVMAMETVDDGTIDLLVLTPNAGELELLKQMKSRPSVVRTKHYCHSPRQWEQAQAIFGWFHANGYVGGILEVNQYATFHHIAWQRGH